MKANCWIILAGDYADGDERRDPRHRGEQARQQKADGNRLLGGSKQKRRTSSQGEQNTQIFEKTPITHCGHNIGMCDILLIVNYVQKYILLQLYKVL